MLSSHFDEAILSNHKKSEFIIDVIGKVRYIEYGERRNRESRTAPILGIEKKDRAEMLGNNIRPTGRNSTSKHGTMWAQIATSHIAQDLAEGAAPTTPN